MKAMILSIAMVMAAGCTQTESKGRQFGSNPPGVISEAPLLREARLRNEANPGGITPPMPNLIPMPAYTPMVGPGSAQPTVVTGGGYPVTTITPTPMGGSTIVNYGLPAYRPPVVPSPYYGY